MLYRFFLDGNLISHPMDWEKFNTTIRRDIQSSSINVIQNYDLTFNGDEYRYFQNRVKTLGFCESSEIYIEYSEDNGNNWYEFHRGVIYLTDITFDQKRNEAQAKVQDNSFYAYINNNKDLGVYPYNTETKNGEPLTPLNLKKIQMYDCATGLPLPIISVNGYEYKGYKVFDLFELIISYISDNKIKFKSDCFGIGGDYENILLTTGYVVRYSNSNAVAGVNLEQWKANWKQISFMQLFNEMHKRFNLTYWIEYIAGSPYLRVEKNISSYTNNQLNLSDSLIDELEVSIDKDLLYSQIVLGSNKTEYYPYLSLPNAYNLLKFSEEKILISGQCNLNNTLDIKTEWISDSNLIEDLAINGWTVSFGTDEYDQDVVVLKCIHLGGGNYDAEMTNFINGATTPVFYNEFINNYNVLFRFFPNISFSYTYVLSNNSVIAYRDPNTAPLLTPFTLSPVRFNDDTTNGFDPNNNYGNGTSGNAITLANSRFTAPSNTSYFNRFEFEQIDAGGTGTQVGNIIEIRHYNAGNVLINTYGYGINSDIEFPATTLTAYRNVVYQFPAIYMSAGDYLEVSMVTIGFGLGWTIRDDIGFIKWSIIDTDTIALIDQIYIDQRTDNIYKSEFTLPMGLEDLIKIKNNLPSQIQFNRAEDNAISSGWIKNFSYSHKDNQAKITVISNKINLKTDGF